MTTTATQPAPLPAAYALRLRQLCAWDTYFVVEVLQQARAQRRANRAAGSQGTAIDRFDADEIRAACEILRDRGVTIPLFDGRPARYPGRAD